MFTSILSYLNVDLVIVGIAIIASAIIGTVVFLNDRKSITNITFFLFSLSSIFWNTCNYLFYQPNHSPEFALLLLRLVVFFAIWYCFFLFQFFYVFPEKKMLFLKKYLCFLLLPIAVSSIALTPLVFKEISSFSADGRVATVLNGFGIYIFGATVIFLIFSSFYVLITKLLKTRQKSTEREQFIYILIGAIITFSLHITFNMVLPAFFNISQYTALGAVFTLPFGIFTSLAIIKYKLFNVKVIATELITFALWIFILIRALVAQTINERIIDGALFIVTVIVGTLLIRSVMKEVKQREQLEVITGQLENANDSLKTLIKQRESLVHLVTHKVKGSFTRTKFLFAGMLDGTFGPITPEIKKRAEQGLEFDNGGIQTVDLVLNVANLQSGIIKYDMKNVDFKKIILETIEDKKVHAEAKGLKIETEIKEGVYDLLGDSFWLKEIINNLIDNSIKYTKEGKIAVGLEIKNDKVLLSIKDTGIGITEEDKNNLFTEGGRGRDSVKVNVDSTGYGLFTVKLVTDAHKGRVWAESEGENKGSQFYVELPAA